MMRQGADYSPDFRLAAVCERVIGRWQASRGHVDPQDLAQEGL
jgi:hypothetical protein